MFALSALVRAELNRVWPRLKFVVLSDQSWQVPDDYALFGCLDAYAGRRQPFLPGVFECEEFSIDFMAFARRLNAQEARKLAHPGVQARNWPLGVCCGTRIGGVDADHWCNVCWSAAGMVLIEPQTGRMWSADADADQIYFVLM